MTRRLVLAPLLALACGCSQGLEVFEVRPPASITGQAFNAGAARIYWEGVPGIDEYRVYSAPSDGVTSENYLELGGKVSDSHGPTEFLYATELGSLHSFVVTSISGGRESGDSPRVTLLMDFTYILPDEPDQIVTYVGNNERMGWALAAGDVNCDGRDDLLVGGPGPDDGSGESGNTSVHLGFGDVPATTVSPEAAPLTNHEQANGWGVTVDVGDVTGDGCAEMLIGSPRDQNRSGLARAYRGDRNDLGGSGWNEVGTNNDDRFGESVGVVGDIDGDGFAEIAVSNPGAGSNDQLAVYLGGSPAPSGNPIFEGMAGAPFPVTFAATGDVTGDGRGDFVVGMPGYDLNGEDRGEVVLLSYPSGSFTRPWSASGAANEDFFGASVASLDFNGDGHRDLLVGSPSAGGGGAFDVFPYVTDSAGFSQSSFLRISSTTSSAEFAAGLARAGDPDFDGYEDVFVAAPGSASVHLLAGGQGTGMGASRWSVTRAVDERFAGAIAAGDFDGDGVRDLAVGAALRDQGASIDTGVVEIYLTRMLESPLPSAGSPIQSTIGVAISPENAWFDDRAKRRHWRCTWDPGDGSVSTVIDWCTPETVGDYHHAYGGPGTFSLTLRVERVNDGSFGESATRVVIE